MNDEKAQERSPNFDNAFSIAKKIGSLESNLLRLHQKILDYTPGLNSRFCDAGKNIISMFYNSGDNTKGSSIEKVKYMDDIYLIFCFILNKKLHTSKNYLYNEDREIKLKNNTVIKVTPFARPNTNFLLDPQAKDARLKEKIDIIIELITTFMAPIFTDASLQQGLLPSMTKDKDDSAHKIAIMSISTLIALILLYAQILLDVQDQTNNQLKQLIQILENGENSIEFGKKLIDEINDAWGKAKKENVSMCQKM